MQCINSGFWCNLWVNSPATSARPPVFCCLFSNCIFTLSPSSIKHRTGVYSLTDQFSALGSDSLTEVNKCFVCLMLVPLYPCVPPVPPLSPPLNMWTVNIRIIWCPDRKSIAPIVSRPLHQPPPLRGWRCIWVAFCVAVEAAAVLADGCDPAWFYSCLAHLWHLSSSHILPCPLPFLQADCQ